MKTPREILLERHRPVEPRLDALRENVLLPGVETPVAARPRRSWSRFNPALVAQKLWQELIWPCRRVWLGLAAVWLAVLACNMSLGDAPKVAANHMPAPAPEMMAALREQERLLAQLLGPVVSSATPPATTPRPRSEKRETIMLG